MSKLTYKHIELVIAVNESKTQQEHHNADNRLGGFREALKIISDINYAQQLMECDMYYINLDIDRPMCCGVFLDWQPSE